MGTHESNGHGHGHAHDTTEGNRQYYSRGWYIPLAGLVVTALGFIILAGWIISFTGTDRWGKWATEEHGHGHGGHIEKQAPADAGPHPGKAPEPGGKLEVSDSMDKGIHNGGNQPAADSAHGHGYGHEGHGH
jgi:hypothetical protein